jgi:hypothetical protein
MDPLIPIAAVLLYIVVLRLGWIVLLAYSRSKRLSHKTQRILMIIALSWGTASAVLWSYEYLIRPYLQ